MKPETLNVLAFGIGAYTHGMLHVLRESGANVSTYLTRDYGHYGPSLVGPARSRQIVPNPCPILRDEEIDFVLPMSIDWAQQPWHKEFLQSRVPIFCPTGEGLRLERDRDFARRLCEESGVPFPRAQVARNRLEAQRILERNPRPYVFKNPLCSPTSPIHTIVCESVEDSRSWLEHLDYAEGVFLQEYLGRAEAGHLAIVSDGEIYSLATNQEYKRAFSGNMGIVAGAPLGGLIERDPKDKYGLAQALLLPLRPWFRKVGYHGPVQVTAIWHDEKWHVLEYNVRLGVTCGPMILRLLENPLEILWDVVRDRPPRIRFRKNLRFGCSLTLAGYGYPYVQIHGPELPVEVREPIDCDLWWNEVAARPDGQLFMTGHRIADLVAVDRTLHQAVERAYANIRKLRCLGSYFRTDVGQTLWPPGVEANTR